MLPAGLRAVVAALLGIACGASGARQLEQRDAIRAQLSGNQALLVIVVDDAIGATEVRLDGAGRTPDVAISRLGRGRNVRILKIPAGTYRWDRADTRGGGVSYFHFPKQPRFQFEVKAGVINYPGDLVISRGAGLRIGSDRINRTALTMIGVDQQFPGLRGRFDWRTDSESPDDFPAFLKENTANASLSPLVAAAGDELKKTLKHQIPTAVSALALELAAPPLHQKVRLSPDGERLAYAMEEGWESRVIVADLAGASTLVVYQGPNPVRQIAWGGDGLLYVGIGAAELAADAPAKLRFRRREPGLAQVSMPRDATRADQVRTQWIGGNAWVLDALPGDAQAALISYDDTDFVPHVYRVAKPAAAAASTPFDTRQVQSSFRLDKGLVHFGQVLGDRRGQLRVALDFLGEEGSGPSLVLRDGESGDWKVLRAFSPDDGIELVAVDADATHVVALTNADRAQTDLVRIDLRHPESVETLLSVPGADLREALVRPKDQSVIGATLFEAGTPAVKFVDEAGDARLRAPRAQLPGHTLVPVDESVDGRRMLLFAHAEDDPGSFYVFDTPTQKLDKLFDNHPAFKQAQLVRSERFVTHRDGVDIVSLLSLPPQPGERWPLVVMPHGGPFGAVDAQTFNSQVQFLANRGYAVLRVNYRGSGGSGRGFESLGYLNWGRQIEDDIDAAVTDALQRYPLDPRRIALVGASYGGYSTLMGLIRAPERYRCGVAVSAVSDLPLMFSSSDWAHDKILNTRMRGIVGDPEKTRAEMEQYSPVYQYEKLARPLLLIHGGADRRVSIEHSLRLLVLLANAGRPPQWLPMWESAHDMASPRERLAVYATTDVFLGECLAPPASQPAGSGL